MILVLSVIVWLRQLCAAGIESSVLGDSKMRSPQVIIAVLVLLASGYTQGSSELYISSLEMPCYPPLARQANVQGATKVKIDIGKDGRVMSAETVEGARILAVASLENVRTWKFAAGPGQPVSREGTFVAFEYRLEGDTGFDRCAARIVFDAYNKVEVIAHPPATLDTP